jgi:SAM-dependent methyltransferase
VTGFVRTAFISLGLAVVIVLTLPLMLAALLSFRISYLFSTKRRSIYDYLIEKSPLLYEFHSKIFNYPLWEHTFRNVPPMSGRVLHLACGTGLGSNEIRNGNSTMIELDINLPRLNYGHRIGKLAHPVVGDAAKLPLRSRAFDCVFIPVSLHHIGDLDGLFRECRRVMADDGRLIIFEPVSLKMRPFERWNTFHDGPIWIFDKKTLVSEVDVLGWRYGLEIRSVDFHRPLNVQNYNGFYNMCDAVIEMVPRREASSMAVGV